MQHAYIAGAQQGIFMFVCAIIRQRYGFSYMLINIYLIGMQTDK
jgi:hypothetical protein